MLSCDLVVAVEEARFGIPEVKRGLMAAGGGLIRLPKRIPPAIALELALTGDPIDAHRALALGLINRVVPADRLMEEALALAGTIAENAPLAVRASKRVMKQAGELPDAEGWAISNAAMPEVFGSADAMEGPVAFAEKRKPNWSGK
jgi:enoyl-CoA hydratase